MRRDLGIGVVVGVAILAAGGIYLFRSNETRDDKVAIEKFDKPAAPLAGASGVTPPTKSNAAPINPKNRPADKPVVTSPAPSPGTMVQRPTPAATSRPALPLNTTPQVVTIPPSNPGFGAPTGASPAKSPLTGAAVASQPSTFRPPVVPMGPITSNPQPSTKPPGSTAQPSSTKLPLTHVVESGETLSEIAQRYYGDAMLFPLIVKANPAIKDGHVVQAGTKLVIPEKPVAAAKASETPKNAVLTAAQRPAPSTRPAAPLPPGYYRIENGDSLQLIAQKKLGDRRKWTQIYEMNRQVIGADPERIRQGIVLKLPTSQSGSSQPAGTSRSK